MSCKVIFYIKFYRAHYSGQTAQAQAGTLYSLLSLFTVMMAAAAAARASCQRGS